MSKIVLNNDQSSAFQALQNFLDDPNQHLFLLEGAAGTGKTTTLGQFVEWASNNSKNAHSICMASPTHKALKVMKEMCPDTVKSSITFSTVHSMLGLKHEITKDGKEIFVRDKNIMTKFPFYDLVIVDESSMIDNQLFYEMEEQNYRKKKVLFIGDSNQINPINHSISIPMSEEKRKQYNIGHFRLNTIVRQAENNPIIKYSQTVINREFQFSPGTKEMVDESGVVMMSDTQQNVFLQLLDYYFKSEDFDKDANYCKIIAWRNVTVDYYNKLVRKIKYGPKAMKIVLDEKLIVDRPIKSDDGTFAMFNTNDDLVVESLDIKSKKMYDKDWTYYSCVVSGSDSTENISILHESEEIAFQKKLKEFSSAAKEEKDNPKRLKLWREYFKLVESFANVKYNYAVTAHNSQGSTYDNCFVLSTDIEYNKKSDEKNRILYTAMTRPRKMLYIL
jgi:hypothetical protein